MRTMKLVTILGLLALGLLGIVAAASASQLQTRYYDELTFYGENNNPIPYVIRSRGAAINQETGRLYVADTQEGTPKVAQYDESGNSVPFPALSGANQLDVGIPSAEQIEVAVDNTGTSTQGNIFVAAGDTLLGFAPNGAPLGGRFPIAGVTFKRTCGVEVDPQGNIWVADEEAEKLLEFDSTGAPMATLDTGANAIWPCSAKIDAQGNFWVRNERGQGSVVKLNSEAVPQLTIPGRASGIAVNRSNGHVLVDEGERAEEFDSQGNSIAVFGTPKAGPPHEYGGILYSSGYGIAINETTDRVFVAMYSQISRFGPLTTITIPTVSSDPGTEVSTTSGTMRGTVDPDNGGDTIECRFEWVADNGYGEENATLENSTPCAEGPVIASGAGPTPVSAHLTGLTMGHAIFYRVVSSNANEHAAISAIQHFTPSELPTVSDEYVSDVNTDGGRIHALVDPGGDLTGYHVEWGYAAGAYEHTVPASDLQIPYDPKPPGSGDAWVGFVTLPHTVSIAIDGVSPGTVVHYRVVGTNGLGEDAGPDRTFTTFSTNPLGDSCANAHVRQLTGAALLPDCRAYELVSAANAGGYDVESSLVPGQSPYPAYPDALDRMLYALHDGAVPGVEGDPTNLGSDPYVAVRGAQGWTTKYMGIPAAGTPSTDPFGSELSEADAGLGTFAFAGANLCSPCFADGETGIPVRLPDGSLVQGMAGSMDPGPSAAQDGFIGKRLSADGTHLIFGSTSQFEIDGNGNGDASIYDRDLSAGTTAVVSKAPGGGNLACLQGAGACHSPGDGNGIGELDISADGSRILLGQLVSTDADGNRRWHLYMNVGDSDHTIDVTPGATGGVLFGGMTSDGSKVFFTGADQLTGDDTDASGDLFLAAIGSSGATLTRISGGGGTGDSNACNPVGGWNVVAGSPDCSAVAIAGGGGVGVEDGSVYFLSPELLDGAHGTADAPNLYVARPPEYDPHFVARIDSGAGSQVAEHAVHQSGLRSRGDFQVTPNGDVAVFTATDTLTGGDDPGHFAEIFRYDSTQDELACVSCPDTGARATGDAELPTLGLAVTDDGRVFFSSVEPLALRDTNRAEDAYEWTNGSAQLISAGSSPLDSELISTSHDGTNAFFFTRDKLVQEDQNIERAKVYDARAGGGFALSLSQQPCKASDECHGPGTLPPGPPDINTVRGVGGNHVKHHRKHRRKRHRKRHHKHHKKSHREHGGRSA